MPKPQKKSARFPISRRKNRPKGLVIVYTGHGKGKTTAALGLILRAASRFQPVLFVQFVKGVWKSGECEVIEKYRLPVEMRTIGAGFTWQDQDGKNRKIIRREWPRIAQKMKKGKYPLVILDEINCALEQGFIGVREVLKAVAQRAAHVHVVLTGRNAPAELIQIADVVTDMREVKHPFKTHGLPAEAGIDF